MTDDRKNIPVDGPLFDRLQAQKGEDDTWNDVMERAADLLETASSGDTAAEDASIQSARIPTEQVEEIARMAGTYAGDEVENRLTTR